MQLKNVVEEHFDKYETVNSVNMCSHLYLIFKNSGLVLGSDFHLC